MDQILGALVFLLGGVFAACYLLPLRAVKGWTYETSWLVFSLVGLLVYPNVLGLLTVPGFYDVIGTASAETILMVFAYGVVWGVGALCWGLMVRYLGIGLGLAVGCGLSAATGTLLPPVVTGHAADLVKDASACLVLGGVVLSIVGIVFTGLAGKSKESELDEKSVKAGVREFDFRKGMVLGIVSGVASGAINFGLQGAPELEAAALKAGASPTWAGMPVLAIVLAGGCVTNTVWSLRNVKSEVRLFSRRSLVNVIMAGLVGVAGVSQFACQKVGEPLLGEMRYVSFAVLMTAAILLSTLVSVFTGEWKGVSLRTRGLLALGLVVLVAAFAIISLGGR